MSEERILLLVNEFKEFRDENPNSSVGLIIISLLTKLINDSPATTFMGIDQEAKKLISTIEKECPNLPLHFKGASQVFFAGMPKTSETTFTKWKTSFSDQGKKGLKKIKNVLELIPEYVSEFLEHGMTILVLGFDPVVASSITLAAAAGKHYKIIICEGSPINDGSKMESILTHPNLTKIIIPDSSIGLWMNEIHCVLLSTDLVLEDGGLIAHIGTYTISALANLHKKPVYCISETFKFTRKFILGNSDLQKLQRKINFNISNLIDNTILCDGKEFDYTPAKFITLLITEKGPIPPSAVTHELTRTLGVN